MQIIYNIITQTVSIEITPDEIRELKEDAIANVVKLFHKVISDLRDAVAHVQALEIKNN